MIFQRWQNLLQNLHSDVYGIWWKRESRWQLKCTEEMGRKAEIERATVNMNEKRETEMRDTCPLNMHRERTQISLRRLGNALIALDICKVFRNYLFMLLHNLAMCHDPTFVERMAFEFSRFWIYAFQFRLQIHCPSIAPKRNTYPSHVNFAIGIQAEMLK